MDITYYTTYDFPIPYKNIKIYPISVKDSMLFNVYSQCLLLDKNSIPDVNIISMTYLEYLYSMASKEDTGHYLLWFDRMLSLCLKDEKSFENIEESIQRYNYDENGKPFFTIGEDKYDYRDFDELKKIIAEQNMVELIDESVSKEVRDSLEMAREYKRKMEGSKPSSLEDLILSISMVTGWSLDYIYSLSIRKFMKTITRYDNFVHYRIYLAASMSGMVEFKDTSFIKHWLNNLDSDDKYKDVSVNLEEMQNKVSLESAKK